MTDKPFAYVHELDCTDGIPTNSPSYKLTFSPEDKPFGLPGRDYSAEYPVNVLPVYLHPDPIPPIAEVLTRGLIMVNGRAMPVEEIETAVRKMETAKDIVRFHVKPIRSGSPLHYDMQRLCDLFLGEQADKIRAAMRAP